MSGEDNWYIFKRLLQVGSVRHVYEQSSRPPYPIIIESPQFRDVVANMHLPEMMPLIVSAPLGAAVAYKSTHHLNFMPMFRRKAFGIFWGLHMTIALYVGFKFSFYKLIGFEDNGLRWKYPDRYIKRYNFTERIKNDSWMSMFARKDFDHSRVKI